MTVLINSDAMSPYKRIESFILFLQNPIYIGNIKVFIFKWDVSTVPSNF